MWNQEVDLRMTLEFLKTMATLSLEEDLQRRMQRKVFQYLPCYASLKLRPQSPLLGQNTAHHQLSRNYLTKFSWVENTPVNSSRTPWALESLE